MKIYPPLRKASHVWGWFHELTSLGDFKKCMTQGFGERPEFYGGIGHNGIDILCPEGTEIIASHDGDASYYEEKDGNGNFIGYGKYVSVRDRINGFKTEYAHLSKMVKTGQVKAGEVIGLSGNTGNSTGPHLHYTLKNPTATDPIPYFVWFDSMRFVKVGQTGTEVWLIVGDKRSHVYNALAFQLINGNWNTIEVVTQEQLDAIPDTGKVIVGASQE